MQQAVKRITGAKVASWIIAIVIFVAPLLVVEFVPDEWHNPIGFGGLGAGVAVVLGIRRYMDTKPELTMDQQTDLHTIGMGFGFLGIASFVLLLYLYAD